MFWERCHEQWCFGKWEFSETDVDLGVYVYVGDVFDFVVSLHVHSADFLIEMMDHSNNVVDACLAEGGYSQNRSKEEATLF